MSSDAPSDGSANGGTALTSGVADARIDHAVEHVDDQVDGLVDTVPGDGATHEPGQQERDDLQRPARQARCGAGPRVAQPAGRQRSYCLRA